MKLNSLILSLLLLVYQGGESFSQSASSNLFCGTRNTAFKGDERITYSVYYTVIGLYINAGTAVFSTRLEKLNNKPVYHVVGTGTTNPSYDWVYRVRDRYESYIDTATLQPLRFIRDVNEGGYKIKQQYEFNKTTNIASTTKGDHKVPACVQDVLSAIYYARNIDFSKAKPDEKIPFSLFLDYEVFNMYIRYLGRETIKTRYGTFRTIKFKPLLVKGTIFEGGENMTVWVTDDQNRIPVRIESPIVVGKVKVDMMSYANIRYPLHSLVSLR
ncbi:MAG: DUF3108 domain-containing protein [Sphingomonadales bacterium]|nr:DUF3108 domain-containing protein [Sphingomonadales bacterium]